MKYTWGKTGIGAADNLGRQLQKIMRSCTQHGKSTRWRYIHANRRFFKWVGQRYRLQKLANLQDKHLEEYGRYLNGRGNSDKYIKNELAAIRFIHHLVPDTRYELSDARVQNKRIGLGSTPDGRADRAWSNAEIRQVWELAKSTRLEYAKLIQVIRRTGCRLDEAATLRRGEAEAALRTGVLHLTNTKGGRPRDIPLSARAKDVLKRAIQGVPRGGYVVAPPGVKVHEFKQEAQQWIIDNRQHVQNPDRANSAHNLEPGELAPLTLHGLRHSFARDLYQEILARGASKEAALLQVAQVLGHNRSEVTKIYTLVE